MQRTALYLSYLLMLAATFVALLGLGARLDFWQVPWMFAAGTQAPFVGVLIPSGMGFWVSVQAAFAMLAGMGLWLLSTPSRENNRDWRELGRRVQWIRALFV